MRLAFMGSYRYQIDCDEISRISGTSYERNSFEKGKYQYSKWDNSIHIAVDNSENISMIGPRGQIKALPPGIGLGKYLLSSVVDWVQREKPGISIIKGKLSSVNGKEDNFQRRQNFYESQSLSIEYYNDKGDGYFWSDNITDLTPSYNEEKITEVSLQDFYGMHFDSMK